MLSGIKHIFFDLDHTLWDFEKNSREALWDMFMLDHIHEKCQVDFLKFIATYEEINHHYWNLYNQQLIKKEELRYKRFYDAFLSFGYDNIELAHHWANEYLRVSPYKTNLMDGAIEVLDYLKPKYTLHLITNGFAEVQNIKLDHSQIRSYFSQIIISEEHGVSKPDVGIFQLAEKLSFTNHHECVMIGDNYDTDIRGAISAGWKSVYYYPNQNNTISEIPKQVKVIHRLLDLKSML